MKVNTDPTSGNEKLVLKGSFNLRAGVDFSDLDPRTHGARVVGRTALGATVLDVALPAGTYTGKGTRGWKTNTKGYFWQYLDKTGSPVNGVTGLKANDKSKGVSGGLVALTVSGKDGTYPVGGSDSPLEAVVVLGNQTDAIAGMCGESAYGASECTFNGWGNSLKSSGELGRRRDDWIAPPLPHRIPKPRALRFRSQRPCCFAPPIAPCRVCQHDPGAAPRLAVGRRHTALNTRNRLLRPFFYGTPDAVTKQFRLYLWCVCPFA